MYINAQTQRQPLDLVPDKDFEMKRSDTMDSNSSKKRKRGYEADSTSSGPLTILSANHLCQTSLPTPTPSNSSLFSEYFHADVPPSSAPTSHAQHISKRIQLTPNLTRPSILAQVFPGSYITSPSPNLYPCHICHRRPTTVQDLPSYADCETCQHRTCYVCMRTCEGPRCHLQPPTGTDSADHSPQGPRGKNVCGKCCVEVGVEGRVWCLPCYDDDADEEDYSHGKTKDELQVESVQRVAGWLQDCGEGEWRTL